ncbi:probable DNA damage-inducible protein 1 [Zygosaccharomyces bailii ISA1307]|nr:probable DNA damage-inducible protein 1 [Zygosaccharomyces bailii ISA1307]
MNLTISNESTEQVYGPLEVSGEMTLQDLTALIEIECGFQQSKHDLYHNASALNPTDLRTLATLGLADNDLLLIRNKVTAINEDHMSDDSFVEQFRQELLLNQPLRSQLTLQIPELDRMLIDRHLFRERLGPLILQRRYGFGANSGPQNPFGIPQDEYTRLMNNPDDPANQERIAELINQQEIDEQMRNALEYTPEMFTTVHMLFIHLEINGHPVKAFVDTGAQATIMSTKLAESTGLARLIDRRFVGEARGVGTGKIIGKIHQAQVKIETQYIPCSFTVLDTEVDLLLGLDMLKRHQACVDLQKDVLKIAGVETKFLGESEIPKVFAPQAPFKNGDNLLSSVPAGVPLKPSVAAPSGSSATNGSITESKIKQLTDLGFSRHEAVKALKQTNGNAELAAALLFG